MTSFRLTAADVWHNEGVLSSPVHCGDLMINLLLPLMVVPLVIASGVSGTMQAASAETQKAAPTSHSDVAPDAASAEMQNLMRAMSGRWAIDVRFESSSEMPGGAQGKGEELWKPLASGLVLSDEEKIELAHGTVHLLGLIWWDRASKEYRGMECVNQNPHTCDAKASASQDVAIKWDGKQLTIEQPQNSSDGKKGLWHETFSEITPTSFVQVGESWDPGGQHQKVVTVRGTRIPE
jgi:hypothetical protein